MMTVAQLVKILSYVDFWHPGNGNVTRNGLLLLGHTWPESPK